MLENNKIYNIDVIEGLKQLDSESIDCCITSPPYWALRDYGNSVETVWNSIEGCEHKWNKKERYLHRGSTKSKISGDNSGHLNETKVEDNFCSKCSAWKGQLGLEPTFDLYIKHLIQVFDEIKRVLKKTGTVWVNMGDTYSGSHSMGFANAEQMGLQKHLFNNWQMNNRASAKTYLPDTSLCLIPFRFAIEMINKEWILRNDIVWYKRNSMPSSVKDIFSNKWEHIFFFVKSKKYYFDLDAVRKSLLPASIVPNNAGYSKASAFNYRVREAVKGTLEKKFGNQYSATEKEISNYKQDNVPSKNHMLYKGFNKRWKAKHNSLSLESAEALGEPRAREVRYKDKHQKWALETGQSESYHGVGTNPLGGNPGDFWDITTQPNNFKSESYYGNVYKVSEGCPIHSLLLGLCINETLLDDGQPKDFLICIKYIDDCPYLMLFFEQISNSFLDSMKNHLYKKGYFPQRNDEINISQSINVNKKLVLYSLSFSSNDSENENKPCHNLSIYIPYDIRSHNLDYCVLSYEQTAILRSMKTHKIAFVKFENDIFFLKTSFDISNNLSQSFFDSNHHDIFENRLQGDSALSEKEIYLSEQKVFDKICKCTFLKEKSSEYLNITSHFACYPERLCEVPIKVGCPENGLVLDPFIGSGTTALVAKRLGRNFIGFELNPSYIEIAKKRLSEVEQPLKIFL